MVEPDIASSAFFVSAIEYSVVVEITLSAVDTAIAELAVVAVSDVVLNSACQRKEQNCLDTNRVTTHKHENAHFLDVRPRTSMCGKTTTGPRRVHTHQQKHITSSKGD